MSTNNDVRQLIKRYPERLDYIIDIEEEVGSSFFKIDYVPERFRTGVDLDSQKTYTKAVDIVKYLKAKNATLDMFEEEALSCSSFYHLCE